MNIEELFDKITDWESDNGESFYDYFCQDHIKESSWAFWLLGKGYTEHANRIICEISPIVGEILNSNTHIGFETVYCVYPEYDSDGNWLEENNNANLKLISEFLISTPFYANKVLRFFKEYE